MVSFTQIFALLTTVVLLSVGTSDPVVAAVHGEKTELAIFATIEIEETGSLTLRTKGSNDVYNNSSLWGLKIIDNAAFERFIRGRSFYCIIVIRTESETQADCYAGFRETKEKIGFAFTSRFVPLFDWLPEFNIAERSCEVSGVFVDAVTDFHSGYSYGCPKPDFPVKSRLHRESSLDFPSLPQSCDCSGLRSAHD